jgi:hypothetical protein
MPFRCFNGLTLTRGNLDRGIAKVMQLLSDQF